MRKNKCKHTFTITFSSALNRQKKENKFSNSNAIPLCMTICQTMFTRCTYPMFAQHSIGSRKKTGWLMLSLGYIHIDFLSQFELFDCQFFFYLSSAYKFHFFPVIFVVVLYQFMYFIFVPCNKWKKKHKLLYWKCTRLQIRVKWLGQMVLERKTTKKKSTRTSNLSINADCKTCPPKSLGH